MLSAYRKPSPAQRASGASAHLLLLSATEGRCYDGACFTEDTKAQSGEATCLSSHSQEAAEWDWNPDLQSMRDPLLRNDTHVLPVDLASCDLSATLIPACQRGKPRLREVELLV